MPSVGIVIRRNKTAAKEAQVDSRTASALADAETVLSKIRPYVRTIDSIDIQAMANGDICVALGYNGSFVQARNRARRRTESTSAM